MQTSFDIVTVIMILGAVQGVFLSFLIYSQKKEYNLPGKFLSALILFISLLLFLAALYQSKNYSLILIFGPFLLPVFLTPGPLLYFYTRSLTDRKFQFSVKHLVHFIPYAIGVVVLSTLYFRSSGEQHEFINNFYYDRARLFELAFRYADILLRACYTFFALKILYRYKEELKNEFSSTEKFDYTWLKQLLIYCMISIFFLLIITVMNLGNNIRLIVGVYFSLLMYVIGYKFIKLKDIYSPAITEEKKVKYQKSGLSEKDKQEIGKQLENLMKKEKLHHESDISCGRLSLALSVNQNHLSQVINERFGKNFFEYINSYRIEEAKLLLISKEAKDWTILAIAFEVGFQSKSTFNSVFKKITKMTPSQYREKYLKQVK
ncbi:MAG: helix-turn-helix domain-containing protein [bacterium]